MVIMLMDASDARASFACTHLMLVGVVEDQALALLPVAGLVGDSHPARMRLRHQQRQVHARAQVAGGAVRGDA